MNEQTFSEAKFKELIVYIARASKQDPRFGAIKLNKILYFSDFAAYRLNGKSITGAKYQHLSEGPAPTPLLPMREQLVSSGAICLTQRAYFNGFQKYPEALRGADESIFDVARGELLIVDQVIKWLWDKNAREVSDLSHKEPGWLLTDEGDIIHYRTAWMSSDPLTVEQIELGKAVARKHGLARKSA